MKKAMSLSSMAAAFAAGGILFCAPVAGNAAPVVAGYEIVSSTPGLAEAVAERYSAPVGADLSDMDGLIDAGDAMLRAAQSAGYKVIGSRVLIDPCSKRAFVEELKPLAAVNEQMIRWTATKRPEGIRPGMVRRDAERWKQEASEVEIEIDYSMTPTPQKDVRIVDPFAGCQVPTTKGKRTPFGGLPMPGEVKIPAELQESNDPPRPTSVDATVGVIAAPAVAAAYALGFVLAIPIKMATSAIEWINRERPPPDGE